MKRLSLLLCVLAVVLFARPAHAQRAYFDGTWQSNGTFCPVIGNFVTVLNTYVGYFTDPNEPYPKTGDLGYVRAVAANVAPCVNDAPGFDFFLPDGATLAISPSNPVYCIRGRFSDGYWEYVPNDANGGCSQTPQAGAYGGYFFGWSALPSGWYLDIRVPVIYNKQLLGMGGPNSHRLSAVTSSAYGALTPYQPVTVFYEADYLNLASSNITPTSASLALDLVNYYKDGLFYIDYGTTNAFGTSLPATNIPSTGLQSRLTPSLTGLNPGTPYFWRARFVTTAGTFNSPTQTFTTGANPGLQQLTVGRNGTGTVTGSGINCGSTCTVNLAFNTAVSLTASPGTGWRFSNWTGGVCNGSTNTTCAFTITSTTNVTANFFREIGSLSLTLGGLPAGNSVTLGITGPENLNTTRTLLTGTGVTLSDVVTGTYTVSAPVTSIGGRVYMPTAASQSTNVSFGLTSTVNVTYAQAIMALLRAGDYDGDNRADTSVFRPSQSGWYLRRSTLGVQGLTWGTFGDLPVQGDYDGDNRTDVAVYRPSAGAWYIVNSSTGQSRGVAWGAPGDIPVPADYDGDGRTDVAVFRPSNNGWFIINSSTGLSRGTTWGTTGDIPVPADYDGDGRADVGVFRPSDSGWYIVRSSNGQGMGLRWGTTGDVPVIGDVDGDGRADIGVFRPSDSGWYIVRSSNGQGTGARWGTTGDVPVFGDFDGDGRDDIAVFRPSTGAFYVILSGGGSIGVAWGTAGDLPV